MIATALLTAAVAVAGCASSVPGAPQAAGGDASTAAEAELQDVLDAAVLRVEDLPAGWVAEGPSPDQGRATYEPPGCSSPADLENGDLAGIRRGFQQEGVDALLTVLLTDQGDLAAEVLDRARVTVEACPDFTTTTLGSAPIRLLLTPGEPADLGDAALRARGTATEVTGSEGSSTYDVVFDLYRVGPVVVGFIALGAVDEQVLADAAATVVARVEERVGG